MTNDKHNFIKQVLSNFYVFTCMDAIEFNLAVRSLATFLRKNKNVGLLVIDGIHFIESNDFMSNFEKRQTRQSEATKKSGVTMEEMAKQIVPTGDDFFDSDTRQPVKSSATDTSKQFYIHRKAKVGTQKFDPKSFDSKLVERSLELIEEYRKTYQFAIVKCQAKPFLRKAAELQQNVMMKGLKPDQVPTAYNPQLYNQGDDSMSNSQLPGYGQISLEGQIQTDDEHLRDRIRCL